MKEYLFRSERLGFRNWDTADIAPMAAINADPVCMEFFPATWSPEKTIAFIERMKRQYDDKGYCYFAVDTLKHREFIGFIGLSVQTYEAAFTPCVDIGWRLKQSMWNKGYATEGAGQCLAYARNILRLKKVVSVAPAINLRSVAVMQRLGMQYAGNFNHPLLEGNERLRHCVRYEISFY